MNEERSDFKKIYDAFFKDQPSPLEGTGITSKEFEIETFEENGKWGYKIFRVYNEAKRVIIAATNKPHYNTEEEAKEVARTHVLRRYT